jgi:hypothetical protein
LPWYEVIFTASYRTFVKAIDEDDAKTKVELTSEIVLPANSRDDPSLDAEIFVRVVDAEYAREHLDEPWVPFSCDC